VQHKNEPWTKGVRPHVKEWNVNKFLSCLVISIICAARIASAALGENDQQLDTRYGKPTDSGALQLGATYRNYSRSNLWINVVLWHGKSVHESARFNPEATKQLLSSNDCVALLPQMGGTNMPETWSVYKFDLGWYVLWHNGLNHATLQITPASPGGLLGNTKLPAQPATSEFFVESPTYKEFEKKRDEAYDWDIGTSSFVLKKSFNVKQ
jgi:hypothetical protein